MPKGNVAKAVEIKEITLVGSMSGTNPNYDLNNIGEEKILIWKRKAGKYLIKSGIGYAIIHAGGLLNKPGRQRELLTSHND
ncbi:NAD(P)H-binding protein [cyanobacterium endosymbiont of Rhopalodia gibberula]|uniref:NAD(P)H-binding protein n=1 Tax=cyanobacterium endosymbiont of Rhopalodia gibberula TaxID=1763363 RepID=UPI000E64FC46|nr:NAD(P)H-binding protein [cyanobacterium endosymbiont of Rhopalodia gibberula]